MENKQEEYVQTLLEGFLKEIQETPIEISREQMRKIQEDMPCYFVEEKEELNFEFFYTKLTDLKFGKRYFISINQKEIDLGFVEESFAISEVARILKREHKIVLNEKCIKFFEKI